MSRFSVLAILVMVLVVACGKPHGDDHSSHPAAAAPPPTPDTTPIGALRTPAGMVLSQTEAPVPTPTAPPAPTPAPPSTTST
jgi:hypothetical protein